MMYTQGVRKIFCNQIAGTKLSMIQTMAENAGYKALAFNGQILVKVDDEDFTGWLTTCFNINDFAAIHELG